MLSGLVRTSKLSSDQKEKNKLSSVTTRNLPQETGSCICTFQLGKIFIHTLSGVHCPVYTLIVHEKESLQLSFDDEPQPANNQACQASSGTRRFASGSGVLDCLQLYCK